MGDGKSTWITEISEHYNQGMVHSPAIIETL